MINLKSDGKWAQIWVSLSFASHLFRPIMFRRQGSNPNWLSPVNTNRAWDLICCVCAPQGSLVDYLRSRGRTVLNAHSLLKFSLWVYLPCSSIISQKDWLVPSKTIMENANAKWYLCSSSSSPPPPPPSPGTCALPWSTWRPTTLCTGTWRRATSWCRTTTSPRSVTLGWPKRRVPPRTPPSCPSNGPLPKPWGTRYGPPVRFRTQTLR